MMKKGKKKKNKPDAVYPNQNVGYYLSSADVNGVQSTNILE